MQKLASFDRMFPTDEACKQYLAHKRERGGVAGVQQVNR